MKQYFLLTFIIISGITSAQPYKSIFGDSTTMWIVKWSNLDFGGIDTLVVEKDTLAYGFSWKKIITTQPYGFFDFGALLREDTLIGKVWYHPLEPGHDSTYLGFDFALELGDTFDLSSNYNPWFTSGVVDSINSDDGKRIRFHAFIEQGENITFIEGVGGNQGPIYKESSGFLYPYLLCAYKDGIQTYANLSYEGNCNPPTSTDQVKVANEVIVYPNPFNDVLYIQTLSDIQFNKVEVWDAFGRNVYQGRFQDNLNIHHLLPGLYFIKLITGGGEMLIRPVIRE